MIKKTAKLGIIILAIILAGITMLFILTEGNFSGAATGIPQQDCTSICKEKATTIDEYDSCIKKECGQLLTEGLTGITGMTTY